MSRSSSDLELRLQFLQIKRRCLPLDKLKKELWVFRENRMAVRFQCEWHNREGNWFRNYGNERWEFDEIGLMRKHWMSINDLPIKESERYL